MRSKPKDALQHFRGIFILGFFQNLTPSLHMLFHLPIKREQTCFRLFIRLFAESSIFFLILWQDGMNELKYGEPRDEQ